MSRRSSINRSSLAVWLPPRTSSSCCSAIRPHSSNVWSLAGHKEKRKKPNQNVVASERKKKTRQKFQIIGRAFRMALTANTKIFYSTINQAALDHSVYTFLKTHRPLVSLSASIVWTEPKREKRRGRREKMKTIGVRVHIRQTLKFYYQTDWSARSALSGGLNLWQTKAAKPMRRNPRLYRLVGSIASIPHQKKISSFVLSRRFIRVEKS